ncbi:Flagellin A2 [uncultured archaeon]|nr:Flagellin A2 [uncultured archaeon]
MKTRISILKDNQADVGIGTLIIFIAMILVAAVAAAVLIQTSGVLQQKAQQTGKEATAEVASNLKVTSLMGQTDGTHTYIQRLNITMELAAGGTAIDFSKVVIKYINETTSTTLNLQTDVTGAATDKLFNYSEERVGIGNPNFVLQSADLAVVTMDLSQMNQQLYPRKKGILQIIPETGTMVIKDVVAPPTFSDNDIVQLFP